MASTVTWADNAQLLLCSTHGSYPWTIFQMAALAQGLFEAG